MNVLTVFAHPAPQSFCRAVLDRFDAGLRVVIDEFTLTYPGIKNVEREYFYAVHGADDATRRGYLERAYAVGRQF